MTAKFRIREENKGNAYLTIYEHSNNKFSYEITFETVIDRVTHSISKQYENGFECCIEGYKELSWLNKNITNQLKRKPTVREFYRNLNDANSIPNLDGQGNFTVEQMIWFGEQALNQIKSVNYSKCECGGNERIALDCTMKPCKHPKYYKTKNIMTRDEFKNKYIKNAFFWVNESNHIKIQEILQEFGTRCITGSGFIKWHDGFKNLCTFPPNGFTGHDFYQKADMWIPNARYGEPKNIEQFFADYKTLV